MTCHTALLVFLVTTERLRYFLARYTRSRNSKVSLVINKITLIGIETGCRFNYYVVIYTGKIKINKILTVSPIIACPGIDGHWSWTWKVISITNHGEHQIKHVCFCIPPQLVILINIRTHTYISMYVGYVCMYVCMYVFM